MTTTLNKTFHATNGAQLVVAIESDCATLQRGSGQIFSALRSASSLLADKTTRTEQTRYLVQSWQSDNVLGNIRWDTPEISNDKIVFTSPSGTISISWKEADAQKQQNANQTPLYAGRVDANLYSEYSGAIPARTPFAAQEGSDSER